MSRHRSQLFPACVLGCGVGGGGASPASIASGLVLWGLASNGLYQLRAGTTACALADDPVGYVTDLSGAGNHGIAAADTNVRPSYRPTDGPGSAPCIRCDGTNDSLACTIALGTAHTLFATFKSAKTNYNPILCGEGGGGTSFMPRSSASEINYSAQGAGVTFAGDLGTSAFKTLIVRRNGTAVNLYVNGTLTDSPKTLGANNTFTLLTILSYAGAIFGQGDLSEFGAYTNDIGASPAAALAAYLNRGVY